MNAPAAVPGLEQLRDIHLPAPVSWWPPAPGWWVLAALLLIVLALAARWLLRRHRRRRYRRLALAQARAAYAQWQQDRDHAHYLQTLNRILKQTALAAYPRRDVAALNGAGWLNFLDAQLRQPRFAAPELQALADTYRAAPAAVAAAPVQDAVEHWIRRHRC